jgi:hypothetical protein
MFYSPVELTGYSARMTIKNRVGGDVLLALVSPDDIALDVTEYTITITVSAEDTAAMSFTKGVYDIEMVSPAGIVTAIFSGNVTVVKEVTA